jgi:hypothetical protein
MPDEWSIVLVMYCSHLSTRVACIDCAAYPYVLQTHNDSDIRRLGNMRMRIENMRA